MADEPATEVIACPACQHPLRVPFEWLGQAVQCPECKAQFRAPVRDGDGFTRPELIARPAVPPPRKTLDAMLLLPTFGLLFCGVAGLIVNGILSYKFLADPVGSKQYLWIQLVVMRQHGFGADDPPEARAERDAERAEQLWRVLRWGQTIAMALSAITLLGGLSITLRWNLRVAQLGCIAASINLPNLCCIPGAVAGLWGLLMLHSAEGRAHFGKSCANLIA